MDDERNNAKSRRWPVWLLATGLILGSASLWMALRRSPNPTSGVEAPFEITQLPVPVAAPELRLETEAGGVFSSAEAKGQVLFVNFWSTWCPPCREEMPSMLALGEELQRQYPGRFKMVAASVDEGWEAVIKFLGSSSPKGVLVALDRGQQATHAFYCAARGGCPNAFLFPESYIVDPQGRLVAYMAGPRDWSRPEASRYLRQLIGVAP